MRYKIKEHTPPKLGDTRNKKRFLFFPKKIGNEIRWLESAEWKEVYQKIYAIRCNDSVIYLKWVSKEWIDEINPCDEIPSNLEECFTILSKTLIKEDKIEFQSKDESVVYLTHNNIGMQLGHHWKLWENNPKNPLTKYFNNIGILHPDDMSGIILISYHRHLNNKPIGLEEQIEVYKTYWKEYRK